MYSYQSFALDLILFLFSSVRPNDLMTNFHSFIKEYHKEFVKTLKIVNCSVEDYTFDK